MERSNLVLRNILFAFMIAFIVLSTIVTFPQRYHDSLPFSASDLAASARSAIRPGTADDKQAVQAIPADDVPAISDKPQEDTKTIESSAKALTFSRPTECPHKPNPEEVLVIMKSGATELFDKLPEQLLTTMRCVDNYMLFSDVEQDVGEYHVYSALGDVNDRHKDDNNDKVFAFYRKLVELQEKHQDLSKLTSRIGWDLDKWKFIPMLHQAYKKQPDRKWYIFLEADSYFIWGNLLEILANYNPVEPYYIGGGHFYGETAFAHGGMGYVVSHGAMTMFDKIFNEDHMAVWEQRLEGSCCGDVEVAGALYDAGVNVTGMPGLSPDPPTVFDFDPGNWCQPPVSWHHVRPHHVQALWEFEEQWAVSPHSDDTSPPYFYYRDLFKYLVEPNLAPVSVNWDNLSIEKMYSGPTGKHKDERRRFKKTVPWSDISEEERERLLKEASEEQRELVESAHVWIREVSWDDLTDDEKGMEWQEMTEIEKKSIESVEACQELCAFDTACVQWVYRTGSCRLHNQVRIGGYVHINDDEEENDEDKVPKKKPLVPTSGWMMDRVEEFKTRAEPCKPWHLEP